jgi:hypothetical protein
MGETRYEYNGEYAMKFISPIVDHKEAVELFDCLNWQLVDVSDFSVKELAETAGEISATWRHISEEEYNDIINKKRD